MSSHLHPITGSEIVAAALKKIGALAAGETAAPEALQDGFHALNALIDAWATEKLLTYVDERRTHPLTAGQQQYTLGPGGDFDQPRPLWLDGASVITTADSGDPSELPITVATDIEQWQRITLKSVESSYPQLCYYDRGWTDGRGLVRLYPIPDRAQTIALYAPTAISRLPDAQTLVTFPPGYQRAFELNLARELTPEYGVVANPDLRELAREAKAQVKRGNVRYDTLLPDPALTGGVAGAAFDWRTGEYR